MGEGLIEYKISSIQCLLFYVGLKKKCRVRIDCFNIFESISWSKIARVLVENRFAVYTQGSQAQLLQSNPFDG